jgi:predicted TIM-barrel fold metal-dependent hydrolase
MINNRNDLSLIREEAFEGKPITVPVIDAHTHICSYYNSGWYESFVDNKDILNIMDALGIDCIVTAPHGLVLGSMEHTNMEAEKATKEYPQRIYAYISICPHEGIEKIKAAFKKYSKNESFVGMKFLPGYHGTLSCPEYNYALDFAEEMRCPVLVHTWANNPGMNEIEEAVKRRPNLKLLVAHQGGGNTSCTDKLVVLMEKYPNIYMEICGSLFNQYSIEKLVDMAGEDKVVYGSDLINLDPRYDLGRVVLSTLTDCIKKKILAGNFLELLKDSEMGKIKIKSENQ